MPLNQPPTHGQPSLGAPDASTGLSADEREYEAFAQAQNPLDIEAATWVTRCRNGMNDEDKADLQAWLDADPRHADALADMDATLGDVKQLPDGDVAALKAGLPQEPKAEPGHSARAPRSAKPREPHKTPSTTQHPAPSGLRLWAGFAGWFSAGWGQLLPHAAAAAIAFALVGGGWLGWDHWHQLPTFEQTFATVRGQQLTATLPDALAGDLPQGSTLQLDTATRLEARLYRDRREVRLTDGQAMFTVQSDAERPFHVWAGALRITVVGTRFSVRHTPSGLGEGQTIVSVEEGRVRVARAKPVSGAGGDGAEVLSGSGSADHPSVELSAGQMVVADDAGHLGPVARVPVHSIAPWRNGRLSFDQAPLAEAIAEFERYGRTGLVVRDPAVAALPVGGSYSLQHWQRFAETLPQVLPVRLVRQGGVTEVMPR
ncbi:MAG: FecR domain-containing protein [Aquabacterium sp.]|nr:FecR domain-containing protein [Aquabacterium sp.]